MMLPSPVSEIVVEPKGFWILTGECDVPAAGVEDVDRRRDRGGDDVFLVVEARCDAGRDRERLDDVRVEDLDVVDDQIFLRLVGDVRGGVRTGVIESGIAGDLVGPPDPWR